MTIEEFKQLVREQLQELMAEYNTDVNLDEKSVPEPYDRKKKRKMSPAQIRKRDKVGKAMEKNEKTAARYREKYGDEWKDYIWATASGIVLRGKK